MRSTPKLGIPASSNKGELWEVSVGLPLGQGQFWNQWVLLLYPPHVPEGPVKAEITKSLVLSLSTSIVHSGEAGVFHIFEERGKRGPWPLVCPLLLEEGCAGRWAARPWKHKS